MWDGQRGENLAATMNAPQATRVVSTGSTIGRGPRKISEKIATRIKNKCDPDACQSNNVKLSIAAVNTPRNQIPPIGTGHRWYKSVTAPSPPIANFTPTATTYALTST